MEFPTADDQVMQAFLAQTGQQRNQLVVRFYMGTMYDERASKGWEEVDYHPATGMEMRKRIPGAGYDVYKDAVFVEIRAPGDKDEIRQRQMRESDKTRFPLEWAQFKAGIDDPQIGQPLEQVPFLSKARVLELKSLGIRTAEHLRDTSDVNGQKIMGFAQLRTQVADWLTALAGAAPALHLRNELEQRDQEIAILKEQMAELMAAREEEPKRRGPGRPKAEQ